MQRSRNAAAGRETWGALFLSQSRTGALGLGIALKNPDAVDVTMRKAHGWKGDGESAVIRSRVRWCSTRWRLGVYHGARRGEVAGAVPIDSRDEGRAESRDDFGLISISAEPVPDFHLGKAGTGMSKGKRPREADAWFL